MSFEFFKFSSLAFARELASQDLPVYLFEFAYDLPGFGGYLRAIHTGDVPFLFRNVTDDDLKMWPCFDGIDRQNLERVAHAIGKLYGSSIRNGNPGQTWPAFVIKSQTVFWFGENVEAREGLLSSEWEIFNQTGIKDVRQLEQRLVQI